MVEYDQRVVILEAQGTHSGQALQTARGITRKLVTRSGREREATPPWPNDNLTKSGRERKEGELIAMRGRCVGGVGDVVWIN